MAPARGDSVIRVASVDHSYQTDETYTYDANGNRTNTGYTTGTNNRVTSDGEYNYTYDDEGNRISKTKISDSTKVEYTWDYRNRLTDVVFKNASGTVTKQVQYKYDVFDRRIGRKLDSAGDGTYETATYWAYDDGGKRDPNTGTALDDIILEFTDSDGDGSGAATLSTRYLHGPGADQILASETVSGSVVNWSLTDHQGTIRDIARYASGTTTVVNHRKYDAFGTLTAESDSTVEFLYSYTGREWDGDAALYYYRARWYDSKLGRFILEDPMGFSAGDTNLSRYVGNSSVNGRDPSGLEEDANSGVITPQMIGSSNCIDGHHSKPDLGLNGFNQPTSPIDLSLLSPGSSNRAIATPEEVARLTQWIHDANAYPSLKLKFEDARSAPPCARMLDVFAWDTTTGLPDPEDDLTAVFLEAANDYTYSIPAADVPDLRCQLNAHVRLHGTIDTLILASHAMLDRPSGVHLPLFGSSRKMSQADIEALASFINPGGTLIMCHCNVGSNAVLMQAISNNTGLTVIAPTALNWWQPYECNGLDFHLRSGQWRTYVPTGHVPTTSPQMHGLWVGPDPAEIFAP